MIKPFKIKDFYSADLVLRSALIFYNLFIFSNIDSADLKSTRSALTQLQHHGCGISLPD